MEESGPVVLTYFHVAFQHFPEEPEENHKNLSQDRRRPCREFNPTRLE
jgi:hypothetical protein